MYYNRAAWGAAPPQSTSPFQGGQPTSLTLHWVGSVSALKPEYTATVRSIQQHAFGKGLSDIDYNFLVDIHGNVYEGRGAAVRSGAQHVGNATSLAVCYIETAAPMSTAAQAAVVGLCVQHARGGTILPHNYWNQFTAQFQTGCPGPDITAWCNNGAHITAGGDMPLTNADYDGMKATVGNYVIGTLQGHINTENTKLVNRVVAALVASLPAGTVDVDTLAKKVANELATRLAQ